MRLSHIFLLPSTALALAGPSALAAQPEGPVIANPSFEAFYVEPGAYRTGDITGWQRDGGTRNHIGIQSVSPALFDLRPGPGGDTPHWLPAPGEGPQFAFINPPPEGGEIALYQVAGPLRARTRYTLVVAIGSRLDKTYPNKVLLELRNGDTPASPILAAASNADAPPRGGFADHRVSFETGPHVFGNLLIAIRNQSGQQIAVDNVRLLAERAVPAAN